MAQTTSLIFTLESTFARVLWLIVTALGPFVFEAKPFAVVQPTKSAWMEERCLRSQAHANLLREGERERGREKLSRLADTVCQDENIHRSSDKLSEACLHGIISAFLRKQRHVCFRFYGIGPRSINRSLLLSFEPLSSVRALSFVRVLPIHTTFPDFW